MSEIPYDKVMTVPISLLANDTLTPFLNTPVILRKRQTLSVASSLTTEELLRLCPLNSVQNADVAAGCIAGIYNKLCSNPFDATLLAQCHDAYNRAFAAYYFKSLGANCPAWRYGPRSELCASAILTFTYRVSLGYDSNGNPVYVNLNRTHASQLVGTIFADQRYAPCMGTAFKCMW